MIFFGITSTVWKQARGPAVHLKKTCMCTVTEVIDMVVQADRIHTNTSIGRELGRTRDEVYRTAKRLGIEPVPVGRTFLYSDEQAALIGQELQRLEHGSK